MTTSEKTKTQFSLPSDREILITRTFEAPRDLLWQMYTRAEHLVHWWGPEGWTLPVCEVDFRPGGTWFYCMEGPDGFRSCGKTFYIEIEAPARMVYRDIFVDSAGEPLEGMPEAHTTVEFIEE
ncbi:MAG: SRPBCC domain-containing protein, partial [Anaerolineales bacterium]|nr:SRPBCC domain-containing protein [Anaerolineales bacterium]